MNPTSGSLSPTRRNLSSNRVAYNRIPDGSPGKSGAEQKRVEQKGVQKPSTNVPNNHDDVKCLTIFAASGVGALISGLLWAMDRNNTAAKVGFGCCAAVILLSCFYGNRQQIIRP